jgi:hypothetical protein
MGRNGFSAPYFLGTHEEGQPSPSISRSVKICVNPWLKSLAFMRRSNSIERAPASESGYDVNDNFVKPGHTRVRAAVLLPFLHATFAISGANDHYVIAGLLRKPPFMRAPE